MNDFNAFDGDLKDFAKSEIYSTRVEIMENLENKNQIIEDN